MSSFFFAGASFISGAFALGAVSAIYFQYRTRVVRFLLLFILSLFLLSMGFWTKELASIPCLTMPFLPFILLILQSAGSALNVIIVPYLVSSLINLTFYQKSVVAIWIWNSLFIIISLSAYLYPAFEQYRPVSAFMMVATILFWLIVMVRNLGKIRDQSLKRSLLSFTVASSIFLFLLVLDILITTVPISSLAILDNFSMPLYIAAINTGSFFFAGGFLNRGAYADGAGVTELFCRNFDISRRETDLINKLLEGKSNRQIGDELCISVKTVENHLGSIYRKTDVTGRSQLIHMLHSWEKG